VDPIHLPEFFAYIADGVFDDDFALPPEVQCKVRRPDLGLWNSFQKNDLNGLNRPFLASYEKIARWCLRIFQRSQFPIATIVYLRFRCLNAANTITHLS
jgi:hypothetical protein